MSCIDSGLNSISSMQFELYCIVTVFFAHFLLLRLTGLKKVLWKFEKCLQKHGFFVRDKRCPPSISAGRPQQPHAAPPPAENAGSFQRRLEAKIREKGDVWPVVEHMRVSGVKPNAVMCSILFKYATQSCQLVDVERIMALLDQSTDKMDELLIATACEACIRARGHDILKKFLKKFIGKGAVRCDQDYTFSRLIRAYGFVHDMDGLAAAWNELRSRRVPLSSVTIGCFVEAVVSNNGPEAGYQQLLGLLRDQHLRPLINGIVFCSVLKGFVHQKKFQRVREVYLTLLRERVDPIVDTYNIMMDMSANLNDVTAITGLLQDMAKQQVKPNLITLNVIIKAYCQDYQIDRAFKVLTEMKRFDVQPDEFTFNTLLNGCARDAGNAQLYKRGLAIIDEMQACGIQPSIFTLSIAVKLANRSHQSEKTTFALCTRLSETFGLRLNEHVYNNLIQCCVNHRSFKHALSTFESMMKDNYRPDSRTYTLMIKCGMGTGMWDAIICFLRVAHGLHVAALPFEGVTAELLISRDRLQGGFMSEVIAGLPGDKREAATQTLMEIQQPKGMA